MANLNSNYVGKQFSCPLCQSNLKFTRAPKSLLQKCPNCRKRLRLQEKKAAASKDKLLQEAIDSLVDWTEPEKKSPYNYRLDPALDRCEMPKANHWKFAQPWPEYTGDVVMENVEVFSSFSDASGALQARQSLVNGKFRRVTVFRTGQVEEIEVTGHWYDVHPFEHKVGILQRKVVRELNKNPLAKKFAARINTIQLAMHDDQPYYQLFIDLAIDTTPSTNRYRGTRRRF